jgi:pimeloyl-ACP methyl ester carboxylesterase
MQNVALSTVEDQMKNSILQKPLAAFAALALLSGAAHAAGPSHRVAHNVVLVHGAFVDETSWDAVAAILRDKGYNVTEVANPLTSLADDVAATNAVLAKQHGPTILVGHSWGGVVIGEAGNAPNVKALVYVAAFAPDKGESLGALLGNGPPSEGVKAIKPDSKGFLSVAVDAFPTVFAGDLPPADAASLAKRQLPLNSTAFATPAKVAAWHLRPTYYAVSASDLMIPPQAEAFFAARMKAKTVTLSASHASPLSQPAAVADLIIEASKQ